VHLVSGAGPDLELLHAVVHLEVLGAVHRWPPVVGFLKLLID
jgi:hypothetical protein